MQIQEAVPWRGNKIFAWLYSRGTDATEAAGKASFSHYCCCFYPNNPNASNIWTPVIFRILFSSMNIFLPFVAPILPAYSVKPNIAIKVNCARWKALHKCEECIMTTASWYSIWFLLFFVYRLLRAYSLNDKDQNLLDFHMYLFAIQSLSNYLIYIRLFIIFMSSSLE